MADLTASSSRQRTEGDLSGGRGVVAVNLDAYRRLFRLRTWRPRTRSAAISAHAAMGTIPGPVWGSQRERAHRFLDRLERQTSLDDLDQCFPFQVLAVEASTLEFFELYRV